MWGLQLKIRSRRFASRGPVRIVAGGLCLAFLSAAGTIFATWSSREVALREWDSRLQSMSRMLSAHAAQSLGAVDIVLRGIGDTVNESRVQDAADLRWTFGSRYGYELLRDNAKAMPQIDVMTVAAADGTDLNFTREFPPPPINLLDRDYFQAHLADPSLDLYISRPVRNRGDGEWTFYLSRKIRSPSGDMLGLVLAGLRPSYFSSFYGSVGLGVDRISLLRKDGTLLAQQGADGGPVGSVAESEELLAALRDRQQGSLTLPRDLQHRRDYSEMAAFDSSASLPIAVSVAASRQQLLREWEREAVKFVFVGGAMTGILILATIALARLISQLEAARNAALAAAAAKTRFASNVSHELRTPMNAIVGGAHQLMQTDLAPQSRRYADIVAVAASQLMVLINDILDFSYYEARNFRIEPAPFHVRETAAGAIEMARALAPDKPPVMTWTVSERTPTMCVGDAGRLCQILMNLLSNAVKYGAGAAISLEIDYAGGMLIAVVADTGPGISNADAQRIFEPFERGEHAGEKPGTGLGLTISRKLVEAMSGAIALQSSPGWGARFSIRLPMPQAQDIAREDGTAVAGLHSRSLDILVAEDVAPSRILLTVMLEKMGHRVVAVENGREAVNQVTERPFDLILMDLNMPELDGFGATRLIRALDRDRSQVHIIAVSANVDLDDTDLLAKAGFDDTLLKPVTPARLEFMIAHIAAA